MILITFILSTATYAQTKIVFLGDSLTEGYGLSKEQAFPHLIQEKLDKIKPNGFKVINGGVSGSTTASGKSRLKWFLKAKPNIVVLALGANDGLRGIKVDESEKNLEQTIQLAQENNLKIILCEMHLPINYGKEYRKKFNDMFKRIKEKYKIGFIPFLLAGVGGVKEMNLEDGIHPNVEGHKKVAENVMKYLKEHI
jgi:acyl-CoA thioesterase-1